MKLTISLVTYNADINLLALTLDSLKEAVDTAIEARCLIDYQLILVNNASKSQHTLLIPLISKWGNAARILQSPKNIGYGSGHNSAITQAMGDYHLVINPDVAVEKESIVNALNYLNQHPDVGMITPNSQKPDGTKEYLCKAYPSITVLLLRGWAPAWLKQYFQKKIDAYELKPFKDIERKDIEIASGCFMFFRKQALVFVKGFDQKYFLYFEDFDLCLRLRKQWKIAYLPNVKISHFGGNASRKGWRHTVFFIKSALFFFKNHGLYY